MKKIILPIAVLLFAVFLLFFALPRTRESTPKNNVPVPTVSGSAALKIKKPEIASETPAPVRLISFSVPILMFHYIRDYTDPSDPIGVNLSVSPQTFERDLSWLKDNNYQTVGPDYLENPIAMPKKPIILSFDDGYDDASSAAFPILKKYSFAGTFYPIVNKIDTPGYLTWDEILKMRESGMFFGSHTLSHPDLTTLDFSRLKSEVSDSKNILEEKLGAPITSFCYPSGKYNATVLAAVKAAGYVTAVTTRGSVATQKDNLLTFPRLRVTNATDLGKILP